FDEIEDSRRKDTLEPLLKNMRRMKGSLPAGSAAPIRNLEMLIQARVFERKLQFIESLRGDSVFPQFHICGTQTDRMSCSNPNSQQMPSPDRETEWERDNDVHFRGMFSPPVG